MWYSIGEIRFTKPQMIFLLSHLSLLRDGFYPPCPWIQQDANIPQIDKGHSRRAGFELPVDLAAETDFRLEQCGHDGLILEALNNWDELPERLARRFKTTREDIEKRSDRALKYISGWRRKDRTYEEWKGHRKGG